MPEESLILASASPRRRELLEKMGARFEVMTADVREAEAKSDPHLSPLELARENARRKAQAVAESAGGKGRWVLGADTIVTLDGRIYGKPASLDEARAFLQILSGRTHEVITACALFDPRGAARLFHDTTQVTFLPLSDESITRYLAEVHVLDKAGAYALQERGEWIVEKVEGSRSNVIGLPTEILEKVLPPNVFI
jgi:septum formation protein